MFRKILEYARKGNLYLLEMIQKLALVVIVLS